MSKPWDVTLKDLIEGHPASWVRFLHGPTAGAVDVIDADLATVSAASDKVIRVAGPTPWLLHVEVLSSPRPREQPAEQLLWYNRLLHHRHELPVRSVLVLLHRRANSPLLNGLYQAVLPEETEPYVQFRYRMVRLWEVPVPELLSGLGTVPLAPLGQVAETDLPPVVQAVGQRLATVPAAEARLLWTMAYILSGLRVEAAALEALYRGVIPVDYVQILRDSSVVQALTEQRFAEGQTAEAQRLLLRQGRLRFGEPNAAMRQTLESLRDLPRLERLSEAVLTVNSWAELLQTL